MKNDTLQHRGMRKRLVEIVAQKGISDQNVLDAIGRVPRHLFMESSFIRFAYKDQAFPIGAGQTTTSSDFYVEFYPQGNSGTAKISYEVFNISDEDDKASITINFSIQEGTGITPQTLGASIFAYPNPVESNVLNISYSRNILNSEI